MTGVDTNILVALSLPNHPHHKQVFQAAWKEHQDDTRFILTSSVAGEFLHVATDSKRLEPALPMSEAFRWLNQWVEATKAEYITDNEAARALWFEWTAQYQLGRMRILDTQFAATLHAHGIKRILTSTPDDFRIFDVFNLVEP